MDSIDQYIEKQKSLNVSPLFEHKLWVRIGQVQEAETIVSGSTLISTWGRVMLAGCVALGVIAGVWLGSSYEAVPLAKQTGLLVNDFYLENFSHYAENEDE